MTAPDVTIALVGAGAFSEQHLAAISAADYVTVVAVVDRDLPRAQAMASRAGGAKAFEDLESALAEVPFDAVDICTPNFTHAPLALQALSAGKHVLVEKPPALSIVDFDRMVDTANRKDSVLQVGLVMRHMLWAAELRSQIRSAGPGPFVLRLGVQAGVSWPGGRFGWQRDSLLSGGHVVHNGMHLIDLASWFLDSSPISATLRAYGPSWPGDDHWTLTTLFEDGSLAVLEYSYTLPTPDGLVVDCLALGSGHAVVFASDSGTLYYGAAGIQPMFNLRGESMTRQLECFLARVRGAGYSDAGHLAEVRTALKLALDAQSSLQAASVT